MLINAKFATKRLTKKVPNKRNNLSISSEAAVIIFDARKPRWSQDREDLKTPKLTKATKKNILKILDKLP